MKTYIAFVYDGVEKAYICQAENKKQMKSAGMNMKLDWIAYDSYERAKNEILCRGVEIKNSSNVTNFKY